MPPQHHLSLSTHGKFGIQRPTHLDKLTWCLYLQQHTGKRTSFSLEGPATSKSYREQVLFAFFFFSPLRKMMSQMGLWGVFPVCSDLRGKSQALLFQFISVKGHKNSKHHPRPLFPNFSINQLEENKNNYKWGVSPFCWECLTEFPDNFALDRSVLWGVGHTSPLLHAQHICVLPMGTMVLGRGAEAPSCLLASAFH